jgi:hypothetical protein
MPVFRFLVAGVSFGDRQAVLLGVNNGDRLDLVPEPDNPHDRNAISVRTSNGDSVGYVPREQAVLLKGRVTEGTTACVESKGRSRASGLIGISVVVAFPGA